ncbi:hypothetical protein BH93_24300 [Rhodococcoides fascians A25f]|uniref:hypothetical protein n=1 Tax=Rhodococcoides fascians TaxID=1828 RepID=UPI0012D31B31|nr:hypothetical protein [Rhodococcus fascians]QII08091.1 hypothetical protein BH93_24300 [Rhodococcus fascians A25f]
MVDIGGMNDWDTAGLERLSSSLTSRISTLIDLGDQLDRLELIDGWVGEASEVDGTDVALMSTDRFTGPIVDRMGSHSDYYKLDTTSQFNQAAVIAGIPDVAVAR